MSGLEGPAVVGGARVLGGLAAPAAKALAGRVTFRWRVARRVRKRVDFSCPWRVYRKWLKTLTADQLARPVEQAYAPLAGRLDDALCSASDAWMSTDDHVSRSLRLVDLTFPAIAAALGDGDQAALTETWAQERSSAVRALLLDLAGPAALSGKDLSLVLQRRSEARRSVRLQAFDINEAELTSHLGTIAVPNVSPGRVVVLLGDFGSGKSESAEAWHRCGIREMASREAAPFPAWLNSRDLDGSSLEAAIDKYIGTRWRHGQGADVVVDGLDEVEPAVAQRLLEDARTLALTYVNSRLLLTARPGILSPTSDEQTDAKLLSNDQAMSLIRTIGGDERSTWGWTDAMRATVTRPFFALATGVILAKDQTVLGEADLIRGLVEDALAKATERAAVTTVETRSALEALAVVLTRSARDELSFTQRQAARSSRLVTDNADGTLRFSLPIFQQWFAAQAIIAGGVDAREIAADASAFNRWRWAGAIAALSAPDSQTLDGLLETWVAQSPGAAAWMIKEAFGGHRVWRTPDDEALDARTSGARLLRALRTWSDALGPLAPGLLPSLIVRGPVELGVTIDGHHLDVAISTTPVSVDAITEVPPTVHPLTAGETPGWWPWMSGTAPRGDSWPWTLVRDNVAGAMLKKLANDPFLGAEDGIWTQERRFDLARRLLGRGSLFDDEIPSEQVSEKAKQAFDLLDRDSTGRISFGSSRPAFLGHELEALLRWIDEQAPTHISRHLPTKDLTKPTGGWVWNLYSEKRLMEFEVDLYGRACEAFDEAMHHSMSRVSWSLPSAAYAPFGAVLEMRFRKGNGFGDMPGLIVRRVPMAILPAFSPTLPRGIWSRNGRAVISRVDLGDEAGWQRADVDQQRIEAWLASQNKESTGYLGATSTGANDMTQVRPASNIAVQWLWHDLKALGLGSGTFPQLR